jgi:hypothetical protein
MMPYQQKTVRCFPTYWRGSPHETKLLIGSPINVNRHKARLKMSFDMGKAEQLRAKVAELHAEAQKVDDRDRHLKIVLKALELETAAEALESGRTIRPILDSVFNPFLLPLCDACGGYLSLSRVVAGGDQALSKRFYRCPRCGAEQERHSDNREAQAQGR